MFLGGLRYSLLLFLLSFLYSCGGIEETTTGSKLSFKMPKSDPSKRTLSSVRSEKNGIGNPTIFGQSDVLSLDDIDCYVVLIAHDEGGRGGNCTGDFIYKNIKHSSVTVPDGGFIEIDDVPTGVDLKFLVLGMKNQDGSELCPDFRNLSETQMSKLSRPVVVGITDQELAAQTENTVDIDISFSAPQIINGCSDGPINWAAGGVYGAGQFGSTKFGP